MNVLITGHTGFLGKHITAEFNTCDNKIVGISRSLKKDVQYTQYQCDIFNFEQLKEIIQQEQIEVIVHSAGKAIISDCIQNPFDSFKVNSLGTASVLEAARLTSVKKVIVVETDRIYENVNVNCITEYSPFNLSNTPYDFSKILATNICEYYRTYYKLDVISVRPVNVFGPGDENIRLVPVAIKSIISEKRIPIQYDVQHVYKNFIYVRDVAQMIHILSTHKHHHTVYNLSTYQSMTIFDFTSFITKTLNSVFEPEIVNETDKRIFITFQNVDGSRFIDEYDFKPTPLETAIQETYKYYYEKSNLSILGR